MTSLESFQWAPLPARKRSKRGSRRSDATDDSGTISLQTGIEESAGGSSCETNIVSAHACDNSSRTSSNAVGNAESAGSTSAGSSSSSDQRSEQTQQDRNLQEIADNVEARSRAPRAQNTLQSGDGCAGEFFEYLDHTADVQCHAWGDTLRAAFEHMAPCMLNYVTDINLVREDPEETITDFSVKGHDLQSLLFNYMHELLFKFSTDYFCAKRVSIAEFCTEPGNLQLSATLYGEIFDLGRHSSGTEIKAITYSNMQIHETPDRCDLFVIVDI